MSAESGICATLDGSSSQYHKRTESPPGPNATREQIQNWIGQQQEPEGPQRPWYYSDSWLRCELERVSDEEACFEAVPVDEAAKGFFAEDFLSLAPAVPALTSEPDGAAIVKKPINFVAAASTHERSGELLGSAVSARFIPVGYDWDFGDGTTAFTTTGGATWDSLGQRELTHTDTSHTYTDRGTYTVTVTTHYAVQASFDGGTTWHNIPGVLSIPAPPQEVIVVSVRTVLVAKDCIQDPSGIGCPGI